ncbi:MAG: cob(I)yrinic acid a,c-diamide adenosyltransferase [Phycisphaerae bacterium]|nr:cob(I)yrinic acid a,c-diamide adenosyltransferase [Phycisphaerae bacterium]MDW8261996.1 cob(I)yrinic acid a,c-diamide adenosyltransferase [Phycisphaerales bacterium]
MKIYTKTGDDGTTGLIGGSRVRKCDPRIELYGTVDELNAAIGLAAVMASGQVLEQLRAVQNDLFVLGSHLATPEHEPASKTRWLPPLEEQMITRLEQQIDAATETLPPLRNFILPGGSELSARLHLARTVCRRAERLAVAFGLDRPMPAIVVTYLNRLSDWLFVQARLANQSAGVSDIPWSAR